MGIIFVLLGAALVYWLQLVIYEKFWKKGLSASVKFTQNTMIEKEVGQLKETIVNQKVIPVPMLRVKFEVDRSFRFQEEGNVAVSDHCYKNDIFAVMPYQRIIRTLQFEAMRRGYYMIDKLDLVSTNLFYTSTLVGTMVSGETLVVYPGYVDMQRLMIPFRSMMGTILTRRYAYEDPFEFQGIRQYQSYDTMKDVNWKLSAKTGELKVNVHGHTSNQEVCLLLNLEREALMVYEALQEESIRIVSSLAELFLEQGIPVQIHSNGCDLLTRETMNIPSGSGSHHLSLIRESLARLDLAQECAEYGEMIEGFAQRSANDTLYVLISTSRRPKLMACYQKICAQNKDSFWILPVHEDMSREITNCPAARIVEWEVSKNDQ